MIELSIDQLLGLVLAFAGIFPTIILIRLYNRTKITDYFLFGLFFLDGICVLLLDIIAGIFNQLIFFQLHHISIDTAYLILFIHACRLSWRRIPRSILFLGFGYYIILFLMTLSWSVFQQPTYATVIFFYLPHCFSTYYPEGAGLMINGVIIYSTGFRYIGEFYRIFSLILLFYAYYFKTRTFMYDDTFDEKITKARRIWLSIWTLFLLHAVFLFPWAVLLKNFINISFLIDVLAFFTSFVSIFLVIAGLLIFYVTFFLPEGLLLSSVQLTRILPLYSHISTESEKNPGSRTMNSIRSYLKVISDFSNDDKIE